MITMTLTNGSDLDSLSLEDLIGIGKLCPDEPTEAQRQFTLSLSWWVEGVGQIVLGSLGFVANCVAIPILLSREMSSIFNRLLTCLAVLDNIFIICSLMQAVRKHLTTSLIQEYLFAFFFYQFHR